jgi:hypothetical protein
MFIANGGVMHGWHSPPHATHSSHHDTGGRVSAVTMYGMSAYSCMWNVCLQLDASAKNIVDSQD